MSETIGKREDDKAFEEWPIIYWKDAPMLVGARARQKERETLRLAFDAAMKRGEEKRGCCD